MPQQHASWMPLALPDRNLLEYELPLWAARGQHKLLPARPEHGNRLIDFDGGWREAAWKAYHVDPLPDCVYFEWKLDARVHDIEPGRIGQVLGQTYKLECGIGKFWRRQVSVLFVWHQPGAYSCRNESRFTDMGHSQAVKADRTLCRVP